MPTVDLAPSDLEAAQFAQMLHVGLSPSQAILYFLEEGEENDPTFVLSLLSKWTKSRKVKSELAHLRGGEWETLSLEDRMRLALDKHYAEKAYFLFSHNFSEVTGSDLSKAQEARKVLEAKLAGTSGKLNALEQFMEDLKTGKARVGVPLTQPLSPSGPTKPAAGLTGAVAKLDLS